MSTPVRAGLLILLLALFGCLARYHAPAIVGADAGSYGIQARLLAEQWTTTFTRTANVQFVDDHWVHAGEGRYHCIHPPGLSLVMAVPYRLLGAAAATWLHPLFALAAVWLTFRIGRRWLDDDRWALLAAAGFALNPVFIEQVQYKYAHALVLVLTLGSLWTLLSEHRTRGLRAGVLAGALAWVRYVDLLLLPGLLLAALLYGDRRQAQGFILGAALPIFALMTRNYLVYGAIWRTGYQAVGEQTAFGPTWFFENLPAYIELTWQIGLGMFFPLGILGILGWLNTPERRRQGWVSLALGLPTLLVHTAWYAAAGVSLLRFFLPTFPFFILAAIGFIRDEPRSWLRRTWLVSVAGTLFLAASYSLLTLQQIYDRQAITAALTARAAEVIPPNSVLIAHRLFLKNLHFAGPWRLVDTGLMTAPAQKIAILQRPIARGLERLPPNDFLSAIWDWADSDEVYWLYSVKQHTRFDRVLIDRNVPREKLTCVPRPPLRVRVNSSARGKLERVPANAPPDPSQPKELCIYRLRRPGVQ